METARAGVLTSAGRPRSWWLRALALRELLPHRGRLRLLFGALRLYARSPLRPFVGRSLPRLAPALASAEAQLPDLPPRPFRMPPQPAGLTRTVALLTGCVMPELYPRTHLATVRVLNRLGYRVVAPERQTCCGALSLHAGDRAFACALARRNVAAFLEAGVEGIIVNSAGCGATMKEYGALLADDAEWSAHADRLAAMTQDVLEFVATQPWPPLRAVRRTVTYQDSCHLVHAQKVTRAPRDVLGRIPGLTLRELAAPDRCCGSAGLYSLVQPEMSQRLLDRKMDDVARTRADVIATANPGCMTQLEAGVRRRALDARVVHVIELLDEAMRLA